MCDDLGMVETSWTFPVARRFNGVKSSPVRDILSIIAKGNIISFAGGVPDAQLFALEELKTSFAHVLTHQGRRALQYAASEGEPELREEAAIRVSRDLATDPEQIQITSGSQEGLYLAGQALLDVGDVVLVERPTYLAAVQAFTMTGAQMVGVPTDENGVIPAELRKLIHQHSPKFVYLVPTFQNPTGVSMPAHRREEVAEVLLETGTALVEDDPYGQLRFEGEPAAPIAAYPGMSGQTLLLNSLSKTVAPGLRLGWVRAEGEILRTLAIAKQAVGLQSGVVDQLAVAHYLATEDLDAHIRRVSAVYRERRDALSAGLPQILPSSASITSPEGGMFLWARLGGGFDTAELLPYAVEQGVAFVPGAAFYAHDPDHSTLRLSYVTNGPEIINEGLTRLGQAIERYRITSNS